MKALGLVLIGSFAYAATAWAADEACPSTTQLTQPEISLPHVASALAAHRLTVAVAGTTSSMPLSPAPARTGYPARLEAALAAKLPGLVGKVINEAKPRQTAAAMADDFARIVRDDKPELLIWQTGTYDAIKGVDIEDFRSALEKGVAELHAGRVDVILMNMQFSPRTESMIAVSAYQEHMRWVALQQEVPLFDRFAIMKEWNDLGAFDFYDSSASVAIAERVHDCLGRLLADFIFDAAQLATKEAR